MGEFNGGGVFTLDNATFVGMGTFVADMGVITMSAHAHLVLGLGDQNRGGGGGVFTLDKATFVGMGTFVADMGVIIMNAHAHQV